MKDIIITSKQLKKEMYILSSCFAVAFLTNIIAIILFKTPWLEMFTQIGYVVVITLFLYLLWGAFRTIFSIIRKGFQK